MKKLDIKYNSFNFSSVKKRFEMNSAHSNAYVSKNFLANYAKKKQKVADKKVDKKTTTKKTTKRTTKRTTTS